MKPTFSDLSPHQRATYGNGCTLVPDFIFTANCRQHDFNYARGGGPKDKLKADLDMCRCMWADSRLWWHYLVTAIYYCGLTLIPWSWVMFRYGAWRSIEDILDEDNASKHSGILGA
jgi:hypothetical protein